MSSSLHLTNPFQTSKFAPKAFHLFLPIFLFLFLLSPSILFANDIPSYPLSDSSHSSKKLSPSSKNSFTGLKRKENQNLEKEKKKTTTSRGIARKFPVPVPKEWQPLLESLQDLLNELKPLLPEKNPLGQKKTTIQLITMAICPAKGTILFFKHDVKKIPLLFKKFRNYKKLSPKKRGKIILQGLKLILHSIDAAVTTKITVKGALTFAKNLKKYSYLGTTKAISLAIGKTSVALLPELKKYMRWAQISYFFHRSFRYLEKNYSTIQGKLQRFIQEGEKLIKKKFPEIKKHLEAPSLPKNFKKKYIPNPKNRIPYRKKKNQTFVTHLSVPLAH
ncbi:MAG: hypothetical protein D6785_11275 [Planctomycetota bacterium]|nr:MAG: hypothetical protein D6785_11275 [Planctomycetota bacterium]